MDKQTEVWSYKDTTQLQKVTVLTCTSGRISKSVCQAKGAWIEEYRPCDSIYISSGTDKTNPCGEETEEQLPWVGEGSRG